MWLRTDCKCALSLLVAVFGGGIGGVGGEGDFGVDYHLAFVGIPDEDVGLHLLSALFADNRFAALVFQELLAEIVLALNQAGCLQEAFQNHFALHLGVALQGTGQVVGILAEAVVQFHQLLDAFAQREALFGFGAVHLLYFFLEVLNLLVERAQQVAQMLGIQSGEILGLALEDAVREVLELGVHTLVQGFGLFFLFGEALFPLPLLLGDALAEGTFLLGKAFVETACLLGEAFGKQPLLCIQAFRSLAGGFLQTFLGNGAFAGDAFFGGAVQQGFTFSGGFYLGLQGSGFSAGRQIADNGSCDNPGG